MQVNSGCISRIWQINYIQRLMKKLEIACHSLASALAAQEGGADRIELCMALTTGGLTPGPGLLELVKEKINIPVHILIRPRIGDFAYTSLEVDTMVKSIGLVRKLGFAGVVVGCLTQNHTLDLWNLDRMLEAAGELDVTFHRAFDFIEDKSQALEDLIERGVSRVLTSGGAASAHGGAAVLMSLIEQAAGRIVVMPGAGINAQNLPQLIEQTKATEYHASAKKEIPQTHSTSEFKLTEVESHRYETDVEEVGRLKDVLNG